jgi:hypothetical protein
MGVPPVWSTVTHSEALHLIYALLSLSWNSIFFFLQYWGLNSGPCLKFLILSLYQVRQIIKLVLCLSLAQLPKVDDLGASFRF